MRQIFSAAAIVPLLLAAACGPADRTAATAAALSTEQGASQGPDFVQDRFTVYESEQDFEATFTALMTALDRRDLSVFAVVDHAAGAEAVGITLSPSTLVLFGNPKTGSPLMQTSPLMGAELPLRALIYQQGETTFLAVTGMGFLERNYGLSNRSAIIDRVSEVLDAIAREATTV